MRISWGRFILKIFLNQKGNKTMLPDNKRILRSYVRGVYDLQELRIQMGNRIVATFRAKLGIEPSEKTSRIKDKEAKKIIKRVMKDFRSVTEGAIAMADLASRKDGLITSEIEYILALNYKNLVKEEDRMFKRLEKGVLEEYPIYTDFFKGVKGIGPAMAGVMISEIDISRADYSSSLWKYAGLDVAEDGKGRSRRAEHLVETEYKAKDGKMKTKMGITFNPLLKTKLVGVLGPSFLRFGRDVKKGPITHPYARLYYDYRNRLENHADYKDESDGHKHAMAIRFMVKIFLIDLYKRWRMLEGLTINNPYAEAKLGRKHKGPMVVNNTGHIVDQDVLNRMPYLQA